MFSTTALASSFLSAMLHSVVQFQVVEAESFASHKLCTLLRRLPFKFGTVMQIMIPCTLWTVFWISIPFTSGVLLAFIASSLVGIVPVDCKAFSLWFGVGALFTFMFPLASWGVKTGCEAARACFSTNTTISSNLISLSCSSDIWSAVFRHFFLKS